MTQTAATQPATRRTGDLAVRVDGAVCLVKIDRPDKLNAMTRRFWADLRDVIRQATDDTAVRAMIVTGAGERAFSAGGDIESFTALDDLAAKRVFQEDAMATFAAVETAPFPVIASVNGLALGGGCELALACDIVLAADNAEFGMPEARLGLVPGYGILRAPEILGRNRANALIYGGGRMSADEALQSGFVTSIHALDDLPHAAMALGHRIAALSPAALATGKRVINRHCSAADSDRSVEALTLLQAGDDAAEGFRAFLERRPADFKNRAAG